MSLHILKFVDLIKATESRGQRDLHLSLKDAKDLHADITKLLIALEQLRQAPGPATQSQIDTMELSGGDFKNS